METKKFVDDYYRYDKSPICFDTVKLILGVSIIVIRYMIRAVIDKEYHMIGIYKAIGRSNFEIKMIYLVSYMVVGIIGMILGLLVGRPLAVYLANVILSNMKGFQLSTITNWISVFVVIAMGGLLVFHILRELRLSLGNYSKDRDIWENLPNYNGYIKITNQEEVTEYLKHSDDIKDYVEMTSSLDNVKMNFENSDITRDEANPMVYSNFTDERYADVPFTKGRICTNPHEITASEKFLDKTGHTVGDYIKISINDKKIDFLIVGSYSAMMKGGDKYIESLKNE